jgi:hypothetical protein
VDDKNPPGAAGFQHGRPAWAHEYRQRFLTARSDFPVLSVPAWATSATSLAACVTLDLVRLLERRPVHPLYEGLGDGSDGSELDRVVVIDPAAVVRLEYIESWSSVTRQGLTTAL